VLAANQSSSKITWHDKSLFAPLNYLNFKTASTSPLLLFTQNLIAVTLSINIYYNLPKSQINLQQIQNSLAHAVVIRVPKICHTTPILKPLHWLEINVRIEYKFLSLLAKLSSLLNLLICTTSWYSIDPHLSSPCDIS